MTVLIFSRAAVSVADVTAALARRGASSVVVNTDQIPATTTLALRDDGTVVVTRDGEAAQVITDLSCVWYRRMSVDPALPEGTPRDVSRVVAAELRAFLHGVLAASRVPVFAPKWVISHADHRPRQLSLARAAGLAVPRALTTTDLTEARAFIESLGGRAITKLYTSVPVSETEASAEVMMTTPIDTATLDEMDPGELRLCPATFQEHLEKAAEYRVTIVGRRLFTARLDASGTRGATDWRRANVELARAWAPAALPVPVEAALGRLMDRLRLDYGAADIVETTDGRFVFLEVNPAGEYLWLAPLWGEAIDEALADLLTGATPSRLHGTWS